MSKKKKVFGKMPIRRAKFGGGHPHVIVIEIDDMFFSIGLTNSPKSGTHNNYEVLFSNGKNAYMVHYSSFYRKKSYYDKIEKYHLRIIDEKRAKEIVFNSKKYKNKKWLNCGQKNNPQHPYPARNGEHVSCALITKIILSYYNSLSIIHL